MSFAFSVQFYGLQKYVIGKKPVFLQCKPPLVPAELKVGGHNPPISTGDAFQEPQWMPKTMVSIESYILCFFFHTHRLHGFSLACLNCIITLVLWATVDLITKVATR